MTGEVIQRSFLLRKRRRIARQGHGAVSEVTSQGCKLVFGAGKKPDVPAVVHCRTGGCLTDACGRAGDEKCLAGHRLSFELVNVIETPTQRGPIRFLPDWPGRVTSGVR